MIQVRVVAKNREGKRWVRFGYGQTAQDALDDALAFLPSGYDYIESEMVSGEQ